MLPDTRAQILDPRTAYQIVSLLEGVVQYGTGVSVKAVGKPIAGKTGTSNESKDTWFVGFSPDLACGVFVGFDNPRTLGRREQGATVAAPIFRDFMKAALADQPPTPFRVPPGIDLVSVDRTTGAPATPGSPHSLMEAFKAGSEPWLQVTDPANAAANADAANNNNPATNVDQGTGGLY
jgi:penicillin-binding protein 1A